MADEQQVECGGCGVIVETLDAVKVKYADDASVGSMLVCSTCAAEQGF
jgi:hypothetical protein